MHRLAVRDSTGTLCYVHVCVSCPVMQFVSDLLSMPSIWRMAQVHWVSLLSYVTAKSQPFTRRQERSISQVQLMCFRMICWTAYEVHCGSVVFHPVVSLLSAAL